MFYKYNGEFHNRQKNNTSRTNIFCFIIEQLILKSEKHNPNKSVHLRNDKSRRKTFEEDKTVQRLRNHSKNSYKIFITRYYHS